MLPIWKRYFLLLLLLLIALAGWQYANQVWSGHPGDIYHRWLGTRELLLNGRSPYSERVSEEIQIGLTGHKYDPRRDAVEQRFYYPIYVVFLMAPTVHLPYPVVKKVFALALLLLTAASVPLWLYVLHWRLTSLQTCAVLVLTLASIPSLQGIWLQNLGLLTSALIAVACFALRRGRLMAAGPLLAFATIKPHLVLVLLASLFLWVTGYWRERGKLVWSFTASMLLFIVAGEWLLPGWLTQCISGILLYPQKSFGVSPLQLVFTHILGSVLGFLAIGGALYAAWRVRRQPADSPDFWLMICFTLAATLIVIPSLVPYSDLQLLPGILLLVQRRNQLLAKSRWPRYAYTAALIVVVWPYLAMLVLSSARLAKPILADRWWMIPLAPVPVLPLFIVLALACLVIPQWRARSTSVASLHYDQPTSAV